MMKAEEREADKERKPRDIAGQSHADFSIKYALALKETRETIYWLRLLKESGLSPDNEHDALLREANEIARIIGAIVVKSKRSRNE